MQRRVRRFAWPLAGLLAVAACGGGNDGDGGDDTPDATPMAPDAGPSEFPEPPPGGQQLLTDQYTVQPGQEKYFCFTFDSPTDGPRAITRVETLSGKLVHHVMLVRTFVREQQGFYECPELLSTNWNPIWVGGTGNHVFDTPPGVAFKVETKTQYLIQYHLQNTTDAPITERSGLNLTYAPAAEYDSLQAAGVFAIGSFDISIPPKTNGFTKTVSCAASKPMNVFAVLPHMHKLGKELRFHYGKTEAESSMMYSIDWQFGDQPFDPLSLVVEKGDYLRADCVWDNPTDKTITFGESSDQEMCFFVTFYYPFDVIGGCVN